MRIEEVVVKTQEEEGVVLKYIRMTKDFAEIRDYCTHQGETIMGYTHEREAVCLRLEDILYFEAVGELVFAYLEKDVYEVRSRLYQLEERLGQKNLRRASKSVLLNVERIVSVRPALNGRLLAKMENGEEVMISRNYAKEIARYIMEEDEDERV